MAQGIQSIWLGWLSVMLLCSPALAGKSKSNSQGRLPRKEPKKKTLEQVIADPKGSATTAEPGKETGKEPGAAPLAEVKTELCHNYLASPIWTPVFLKEGNLYFLARVKKVSGVTATTKAKYVYSLYRITIDEKKPRNVQLVSLRGPQAVGLLAHANPAEGFTVLFYKGLTAGCGSGRAIGTSISLAVRNPRTQEAIRPKPRRTIEDGEYKLVESDLGRQFADLKRKNMRQIDNFTFQQRTSIQYKDSYDPLFWYVARREIFVYEHKSRMLKKFRTRMNNITGSIELAPNEKILQDELLFGILELNNTENGVRIKELRKWTRTPRDRAYRLKLPEEYDVSDVGAVVNFPSRRMVLHGGSPEARARWDKVFIYHYGSGSLLSTLPLMRHEAITAILFNTAGNSVTVITHHKETLLHYAVRLFRINEGRWLKIALNKPAEGQLKKPANTKKK